MWAALRRLSLNLLRDAINLRRAPTPLKRETHQMLDRPTKLTQYQAYIDGKWCDAASGKTFQTFDPYTGEPWALIPECDAADVSRAVEAAHRAFESGPWPAMTQTARGKIMRNIAGLIEKHGERLAQIEVRDTAS
jgi:delta 1-pyrroline-5-carboxylate dehydrogenase